MPDSETPLNEVDEAKLAAMTAPVSLSDQIIEWIAEDQVRTDETALLVIYGDLVSAAKAGRDGIVRTDNASARMATVLAELRASVILPSVNIPDWGGVSVVYQRLATAAADEGFGDLPKGKRRTFQNAVSQMLRSRSKTTPGILEARVMQYLRETDEALPEDKRTLSVVPPGDEIGSQAWGDAIRDQYRVTATLRDNAPALPARWKTEDTSGGSGGGPGAGATTTASGAVESVIASLGKVNLKYQAEATLLAASQLFTQVDAGGEVEERQLIDEALERTVRILAASLKRIRGKNLTENESKSLHESLWSETQDRKRFEKDAS